MSQRFEEMARAYKEQQKLPWDVTLPPPEVITLAEELPPGRMLDLGCGLGRASIYLAERGWQTDGVDFIPQAVETATERARAAGVAERTQFFTSSVGELDFLEPYYDLALDVGCLHRQTTEVQEAYRDQLARLLRPGATYLLFGGLQDGTEATERFFSEARVTELFSSAFTFERIEHGRSNFGELNAPSAWFWLRHK